jgi:hypothetical protein
VEVLASVADPRKARGRRYSMTALLSLCCAGMLCGCKTYAAIAQWGRDCDRDLAEQLGISVVTTAGKERRPGPSTLFYALRVLDRSALEELLGAWTQEVLAALARAEGEFEALAIDGKTLRGSAKQLKNDAAAGRPGEEDVPGVHLLSAFSHRLGLTLGQMPVPDKGSEITWTPRLLESLLLEGKVVTVDALLTQRSIAGKIVEKKGTM